MPRRIDVHHHIFPKTLSKSAQSESVGFKTPEENLPWSPELSLKAMDSLGVDVAILSLPAGLPPGPSGPENRKAAREFNIMAAQICKEYPERFGFFASLPIPSDAQAAVMELTYALDVLRADGVALASSYGEGAAATYIGDDSYDAVWEELDRRGTVVFLHGTQTPSSTPYPHPFLGIPITEVPNETFKAAAHLVVTGKKRRWSNVKIILAHLGGSLTSLAPRVARLSHYMGCELAPSEILEDFGSFYFDTALSAHETTLSAVESFAMPGHVLFGTDFPAVSVDVARYYTENVEKYYKDRPTKLNETAAKLFNKIDIRDEQG
ncbi:amidohydrolase 2 [Laetiporus sulphureus 93-53]|uniref:Amidohydrolase 2 n=1 Tax=Laetiporus sulphureus 93-53 TaxID=1314785 RepID=A0A165I1Z4_9APHY|nr:amidohydrolase 2 [Laetiporus sulphureus 93-53]KZT12487.1 amidohydrolase 2 [Laetiporus sulphureus 93-53]